MSAEKKIEEVNTTEVSSIILGQECNWISAPPRRKQGYDLGPILLRSKDTINEAEEVSHRNPFIKEQF